MLALIPVISKIIDTLLKSGQMKQEEADKIRADLAQTNIQESKTFSDFMLTTEGFIYALMRGVLVLSFASALLLPVWVGIWQVATGAHFSLDSVFGVEKTLAESAKEMPWQFWLIILWPLYGLSTLKLVPWFKGQVNGNGNETKVILPDPQLGTIPPRSVVSIPHIPLTFPDNTLVKETSPLDSK